MKKNPKNKALQGANGSPEMTIDEQRSIILGMLVEFAETSVDEMFEYMQHVGFDVHSVKSAADIPDAWCGYYRIGKGRYDVERAAQDLATWPPIAARIAYLMKQKRKSGPKG